MASQPSPPPPGIYVPMPTFFSPDLGTIDHSLQIAYALHLAQCGVRGLVLSGSTGESGHLTQNERVNLVSMVRSYLADDGFGPEYPLIIGVTSENTKDAIEELTLASEDINYGLVLAPHYFASAGRNVYYQEGLIKWYTEIADASPIPILIYHYPAVSNSVQITESTFAQLARHHNIVGCKLSHGDLSCHIQLSNLPDNLNNKFSVFTGLGQQLFPVISMGGQGAIDGLAGIFPRVLIKLYDLSIDYVNEPSLELLDTIRELQTLVCKAEEFVVDWGTAGIKVAVGKILGSQLSGKLDGNEQLQCRLPLAGGIPEEEWLKWENGVFAIMKLKEEKLSE